MDILFNKKIAEAYKQVVESTCATELSEASLAHVLGKQDVGYCIVSACRGDWAAYEVGKLGGTDSDEFKALSKNLQSTYVNPKYWNNVKTKELQSDLKSMGLGYVQVFGGYKEGRDNNHPDITPGEDVFERSFLIPAQSGNSDENPFERVKRAAIALGQKYRQESVLICPPGEAPYYYVTTQYPNGDPVGTEQRWFGKDAKLNDIAQEYFTSLNKVNTENSPFDKGTMKRFTFKENSVCESVFIAPPPSNVMEANSRNCAGEIFVSKYPCDARELVG